MTSRKKPLGLTATAIYASFSGVIYLPCSVLLIIAGQTPEGSGLFTAGGIFLCILGVFMLAGVYGIWSLQEWGRVLAIWLFGVSIILGIVALFPIWPDQHFTIANAILQLFGIAVAVLILSHLSRPHVKALFLHE